MFTAQPVEPTPHRYMGKRTFHIHLPKTLAAKKDQIWEWMRQCSRYELDQSEVANERVMYSVQCPFAVFGPSLYLAPNQTPVIEHLGLVLLPF